MMTLHKITIFFVLTTVSLARNQNHEHKFPPYDFKGKIGGSRENSQEKIFEPIIKIPEPTIRPTTTTTTTTITYPSNSCNYHHSRHVFSFSNVGLQKIGRDFIMSNDIISLSLDNNDINDISPFAFRNMHNLQYLDLSGNKIPKEKLLLLAGNDKLQTLIIDNNRDSHDPVKNILKEYEVLSNLKHLHLCNSQLRNFQVPFYMVTPILTHLHLSNNSINSSDAVFDNIPATLMFLYLNKNFIDRIKQDKLRHLQELIMNDNVITQICFEDCKDESISLKDAVNLEKLSLSNNLISEISLDAFRDTSRLITLDLSGNKITDIAKGTFNNTNMINNLSLANNTLVTIPDVCSMFRLRTLDLSGNRISAIHFGTFCNYLRDLEYLYLSNNIITTIETRAFYSLQSLKYLDLSGNRLRQLPMHWGYSLFIEELHLERNNFTELDNISLVNIKSLRNIYLDENPMPILKVESFQSLPAYLRIHLRNMRIEDKCAQCQCENDEDEDEYNDKNDDEQNDNNNSVP